MHHMVDWLQAAAKGNLEDRDQLFRTVLTCQQVIEHPAFVTTPAQQAMDIIAANASWLRENPQLLLPCFQLVQRLLQCKEV